MENYEPTPELVAVIINFLGPAGREFFAHDCSCVIVHCGDGTTSLVFTRVEKTYIPHPVDFGEGMQVRNALRESGLCRDWTAHDYDNRWAIVVLAAITAPLETKKSLWQRFRHWRRP